MNLSNIFLNNRPMQNTTVELNVNQLVNAEMVKQQIRALTPGQTILGQIVGKNGSDVQIRLLDELMVNARLDQDMNIGIGKNMTFQVKNNGSVLTLSPLYENVATDPNAMKALDMAGLPLTDKTLTMAGKMIENGMSIDKNSLQQVFRDVNLNPDIPVADIVNLHKLGIPVNEANLAQYSAYQNMNHQLTKGMQQVLSDLPQLLQQMIQGGQEEGAAHLLQTLTKLLVEGNGAGVQNVTVSTEALLPAEGAADGLQGQGPEPGTAAVSAGNAEQVTEGQLPLKGEAVVTGEQGMTAVPDEPLWGKNQITDLLQKAGSSPQQIEQLLNRLEQVVRQQGGKEMQSQDNLLKLMLEQIKEDWLLTPRDMEEPGKVQEFYRNLTEQLNQLAEGLEQNGQTQSNVFKAVTNMNQNLDFLQQLNQMYTYVQLPVKLQNSEAHGDLYVYTNKKHLATKDGQVSALLHLDMEHLGPVDVYVAMQNERLNTNFYLQDDEMLDFINAHMDILTERLQNRGYQINCELTVRNTGNAEDENKAVNINSLIEAENNVPIAMYSFDVRG